MIRNILFNIFRIKYLVIYETNVFLMQMLRNIS